MIAKTVYNQLVEITREYLGPTADRFIDRLVDAHLHKKARDIDYADIPKLIEWIKVGLGLLTNDKNLIDECERKILRLAGI